MFSSVKLFYTDTKIKAPIYELLLFHSVAKSHLTLCLSRGLQHARLPCPSLSPGTSQTHVHWVSDTIQSSHLLLQALPLPPLLLTLIFPSIRVFSNESVSLLYQFSLKEYKYKNAYLKHSCLLWSAALSNVSLQSQGSWQELNVCFGSKRLHIKCKSHFQ